MLKAIKNSAFIIQQIWRISRHYVIYNLLLSVLYAFESLSWIIVLPLIINNLLSDSPNVVFSLSALTLCFLYCAIFDGVTSYMTQNYCQKAELKIRNGINRAIYEKAIKTDLSDYDNPKYYDEFIIASSNYPNKTLEIIIQIRNFLISVFVLIGTSTIIFTYSKLILLIMIVSFILDYLITDKDNKSYYKYELEVTRYERRRDYYQRVFYLKEYAKELRLNKHIAESYIDEYCRSNNTVRDISLKYGPLWTLFYILKYLLVGIIINRGLVFSIVAYQVLGSGSLSIGGSYAVFSSVSGFFGKVSSVISFVPELKKSSLYIDKVKAFLDRDSTIVSGEKIPSPSDGIHLKMQDLVFAYPNSSKVINQLNMDIENGQHIAIVGYNGSGKTTLIKLIMRLYEYSGGDILLNETSLRAYDTEEYRRLFGAVYQDFSMFSFSIAENVAMNDAIDENRLLNSLSRVGMGSKLAELPCGINTSITREFDSEGSDFSGGEKQRMAIARVLYGNKPIIILDEPSSALDPIAEYNLNRIISNELKDKTVIYISHRLSTVVFADMIYMMKNGAVIESGTHQELMQMNGEYAKMFSLQAEKFGVKGALKS